MANEKSKTLDDINDVLIVRKIPEQEPTNLSAKESLEEETSYDFDREQHLLAEEQEAIIRKQLQLLQADERGKQALISEIAAIKQKQEKRAELLRCRQHALDIEKERAKRIALLPPPLPKSVKLLLKKYDDEPKPDKPEVQMPDELKTFRIKGAKPSSNENKENILDLKELEAKQKMQDEWQMKAKKRFNEALKKDRQKEEYSKIMKQIQSAELLNRREMAKSISSEKKCIPCPLSDKFQIVKNQTDMEDAAEKLFKKMNKKEHVIEDIEGYQDRYEEKYRKLDSDFESKMIDCVPNFVKENYEYLLEDESKFQGGKNFSGLNESSSDVLNEAFMETPPDPDKLDGREKIDLAINHLDKLRSDLQTEYDQTLKPLLVAAMDVPRKELRDKAVEAEILKLPLEDKAVETDIPYSVDVTSPVSPPPVTDFINNGVMAFKRRYNGPILGSFREVYVPDMHQRGVHYIVPPITQSERLTPSSWSSSSYCSLPSQHGIPRFPNAPESVKCDICVAEKKQDFVKDNIPHELTQSTAPSTKEKPDKSQTSSDKTQLSEYVQQLAKKYLVQSPKGDLYLSTDTVSPAFERETIPKSKTGFVESQKSEQPFLTTRKEKVDIHHSVPIIVEKSDIMSRSEDKIKVPDSSEVLFKRNDILQEPQEKTCDDIYAKIKNAKSPKSPIEYSEYDIEAKRIQLIQEVLSRKIPRFTLDLSPEVTKSEDLEKISKDKLESESLSLHGQSGMNVKPHIYHELSTIQEMDSALTAGSFHSSQSKLLDLSLVKEGTETIPKEIAVEEMSGERLKMASLLDPPGASIAELAKSIHFVTETQEEAVQSLEVPETISSEFLDATSVSSKDGSLVPSSLISGLSSSSGSSVSSAGKVFSSSLVGNVKYPYLKDTKLLPQYFSNVSDIPQKVSSSGKYGLSSSLPPSEFLSSLSSFPSSSSSQSVSSIINAKSKGKKDNVHSLISGYIDSPASSSSQSVPCEDNRKLKEKKDAVHPLTSGYIDSPVSISSQSIPYETEIKSTGEKDMLISGYISSLDPSSSQSIPPITNPELEHRDNVPSLLSGDIKNIGVSEASSSRIFHPMTPRSDISSPSVTSDAAEFQLVIGKKKDFSLAFAASGASDSRIFHPMTPHSDISSPSMRSDAAKLQLVIGEKKDFSPAFEASDASSSRVFHPMTPHSDISSPSVGSDAAKLQLNIAEKKDFGHSKHYVKYDGHIPTQSSSDSSNEFKPMTPCSYISSPSERANFPSQLDYHGYSSSAENFKALTPISMVSSPSLPDDEAEFHPMTVRFDISTNPVSSSSATNQSNAVKKMPHLNYHLNLKTRVPEPPKYLESFKLSGQKAIVAAFSGTSAEKRIYHVTESQDRLLIQTKDSDEMKAKRIAKVCSSDFFVPQLYVADMPHSETNNDSLEEGTLREAFESGIKPKAKFDSQKAAFSEVAGCSSKNEEKSPKMAKTRAESVSSYEEIIAKGIEEKAVGQKSKEFSLKEALNDLEVLRGKHCGNLHLISSTSSSNENLSEISESKVLYQSTPIKSLAEIVQEPGILEEPDLTLITTEYSCKVDSPEKPREPSNASKHFPNEERDCTLISSQTECKTPTNQSPQLLGSVDTPSMLSFLQHEMSCMQTDDIADPMAAEIAHLAPDDVLERKTRPKGNQRTQFSRPEYKQRTRRLWNNLEEVKKKNLAEERKKLMAVNRLKAKEFAKKLTPQKKI